MCQSRTQALSRWYTLGAFRQEQWGTAGRLAWVLMLTEKNLDVLPGKARNNYNYYYSYISNNGRNE